MNKKEIKYKINNSHYFKFDGITPEGFIMLPKLTLERLKDFNFWKKWVINNNLLLETSIIDSKKI